ncbi:uncharacterized protein LOC129905518 [Episyrphus balteatus]|uniref:uncharacterized protein LOC129905518 n=1 Tax=Episyrphus balteatus TaxID=286459 RepID=UPI0024855EB4|nr:uncharacterized protein LOC129905518 [Episyrphus balteatus]
MGGPVRPALKWKETLTHWKHSLRSRARKLKIQGRVTGGGPPPTEKTLSDFEERALGCFGAIAVDGLPGLPTLGLPNDPASSQYERGVPEECLEVPSGSQTTAADAVSFENLSQSQNLRYYDDVEEILLSLTSEAVPVPLQPTLPLQQPNKKKIDSTQALLQTVIKKNRRKKYTGYSNA